MYLFNLSIVKGIFPDDLKIAKVTPTYKADNSSNVSNYRPISALPCVQSSYNRLQKYLKDQDILYNKQFGFQILQIIPLHSWLIKFMRLSRKTNILWVGLLIFLRLSILLIIQYY